MEPIRFAIVGSTGNIGKTHIDAIKQLTNCRLVGVFARRQELLREQAKDLRVKAYPRLDDVLCDPDVDAIVIATPHPSHKDICLEAITAGKHVLVEKPMAVTLSQADNIVNYARQSGVTVGVLFNNRFRPEALKMRELIDDDVIGDIYRTTMTSATFRTQNYYDRLDWRGTWQNEGGGALINQGIHAIDMFQWLSGMPQSVYGVLRTLKHRIEVEDYASAKLEYENGALGIIHCDTVQAPNQQRMEIYGERGALIMGDWRIRLHQFKTPVQEFLDTDQTIQFVSSEANTKTFDFDTELSTHALAFEDFSRAVIEGSKPSITAEDGLRSQELVAAITRSACRREKVSLPIDRDEYDDLFKELSRMKGLPSQAYRRR